MASEIERLNAVKARIAKATSDRAAIEGQMTALAAERERIVAGFKEQGVEDVQTAPAVIAALETEVDQKLALLEAQLGIAR